MRINSPSVQWTQKPAFPNGLPGGKRTKVKVGDVISFSLLGSIVSFNSTPTGFQELGVPLLNSNWDIIRHILAVPLPLIMRISQEGAGEKENKIAVQGEIVYQLLIDGVVVGEEAILFSQASTTHGPTALQLRWTVFSNQGISFSFVPPFQISLPGGHVLQYDLVIRNLILNGEIIKGATKSFEVAVSSETENEAGEVTTVSAAPTSILGYVVHN